jgi:hypothetical protein
MLPVPNKNAPYRMRNARESCLPHTRLPNRIMTAP